MAAWFAGTVTANQYANAALADANRALQIPKYDGDFFTDKFKKMSEFSPIDCAISDLDLTEDTCKNLSPGDEKCQGMTENTSSEVTGTFTWFPYFDENGGIITDSNHCNDTIISNFPNNNNVTLSHSKKGLSTFRRQKVRMPVNCSFTRECNMYSKSCDSSSGLGYYDPGLNINSPTCFERGKLDDSNICNSALPKDNISYKGGVVPRKVTLPNNYDDFSPVCPETVKPTNCKWDNKDDVIRYCNRKQYTDTDTNNNCYIVGPKLPTDGERTVYINDSFKKLLQDNLGIKTPIIIPNDELNWRTKVDLHLDLSGSAVNSRLQCNQSPGQWISTNESDTYDFQRNNDTLMTNINNYYKNCLSPIVSTYSKLTQQQKTSDTTDQMRCLVPNKKWNCEVQYFTPNHKPDGYIFKNNPFASPTEDAFRMDEGATYLYNHLNNDKLKTCIKDFNSIKDSNQ